MLDYKIFNTNIRGFQIDSQLQESRFEIDNQWTSYTTSWIEGHPSDRLIVFRPQSTRAFLGCIRVYKDKNKLWDVFNEEGAFIGRIPKECPFEAMLVEIKLIRQKEAHN